VTWDQAANWNTGIPGPADAAIFASGDSPTITSGPSTPPLEIIIRAGASPTFNVDLVDIDRIIIRGTGTSAIFDNLVTTAGTNSRIRIFDGANAQFSSVVSTEFLLIDGLNSFGTFDGSIVVGDRIRIQDGGYGIFNGPVDATQIRTNSGIGNFEFNGSTSISRLIQGAGSTMRLSGTGAVSVATNTTIAVGETFQNSNADLTFEGDLTIEGIATTTTLITVNGTCSPAIHPICLRVLPVELTAFDAKAGENGIQLSWITASETNNAFFALERSADGRSFKTIGEIAGKGDSQEPTSYSFLDKNPLSGWNYYRLVQYDYDGSSEIHRVVAVPYHHSKGSEVTVLPNPATDAVVVQWSESDQSVSSIRLFDNLGRFVATYPITSSSNNMSVPLDGLSSGMYYLQLTLGERTSVIRVQKL